MKRICVVGSLNVDLTIRMPRFHLPGETIMGHDFATYTGGKGGNQAVAAARLGADVLMVGCLGDDQNGLLYRGALAEAGVDASGVETDPERASGVALIEVDPTGENRIVVAPGTNASVSRAQIDRLWPLMLERDIFLFQLEIPFDTIGYAIGRLRQAGKTVLLDPAPAPRTPLPDDLLAAVDYLTPNETELSLLARMPTDTDDAAITAARSLIAKGVTCVVAKRGRHGAIVITAERVIKVSGYKVDAVDTTAAGDSFNAGLAVGLAQGMSPLEATRLANAVGALSTTAKGAQGAMPTMAQALSLMRA